MEKGLKSRKIIFEGYFRFSFGHHCFFTGFLINFSTLA